MIRQGRRRVIKISERLEPAIESRDHGEPVAVGEDAELRGWLHRIGQAQPGRVPERNGWAAHDCQQPIQAPLLGEYLDARDERSEEHTSELQSLRHLVCRLLL